MKDIYSEEYWLNEFTITTADLNRFQERILRDNTPLDTTSLVKQLIKGRLEFGHEISPSVLKSWTGKDSVRIWDPFEKWSVGDGIIVPKNVGGDNYECFVGEVVSVDQIKTHIEIRLDGQNKLVTYRYGNPKATGVHQFAVTLAEKKYKKAEGVEGIVARFGNRIVSALLHALESDERFVGLEGKWYIIHDLPVIESSIIKSIYPTLLQRDLFTLNELLSMVQIEGLQDETLLKMAMQIALQKLPERFENIGTPARPLWKALPPLIEKAKVKYYAYDPKTYEVLCRPGEQLPLEKAQRLIDLNLYKFIVTFMDGD